MDHHKLVYPLPTEGELIAFPHGAAGHQGISSNASGDLIIKPCTQSEIDFYEAAKDHPAFQTHMPVYMGKLELGNQTGVQAPEKDLEQEKAQSGSSAPTQTGNSGTDQAISEATGEKKEVKAWIPSGGKKIDTGLAIVLENAVASFKKPNVIDLKLGSRLWDEEAAEAKRQKLDQVAARTTSGSLSFRVAGAKIWLGEMAAKVDREVNTDIKDGYKSYNKLYGQALDENSVQSAIARFISGTKFPVVVGGDKAWLGSQEAKIITNRLIRELENIQYVLEHEESRMYSASVLIVIEGDHQALKGAMAAEKEREKEAAKRAATAGTEDVEDEKEDDSDSDEESVVEPKVMEVRLIDFAHARFTPGQGPDENALKGIRNIISILKEISK